MILINLFDKGLAAKY